MPSPSALSIGQRPRSHVCTGTLGCQAIPANIGRSKVLLIDTPGFDDSERTDSEILAEISKILTVQYELGMSLKGIIYVHRITDIRYQRTSVKTLNIFKEICGKDALKNVLLVTTRWHEVDEALGASREQQLRNKFWAFMLGYGSTMARFYGDVESAQALVAQLLVKETVVLDLQREISQQGKSLNQTKAGALVSDDLEHMKAQVRKELEDLEELRRALNERDRAMKLQVQEDMAKQRAAMQKANAEQVSLQRNIGREVQEDIRRETKRGSGGSATKWLPLIPTVLHLIGMFVPFVGGLGTLAAWMQGGSLQETVTDFLAGI